MLQTLLAILIPRAATVTNDLSTAGSTDVFVLNVSTPVMSKSETKLSSLESFVTLASLFGQHRFPLITILTATHGWFCLPASLPAN